MECRPYLNPLREDPKALARDPPCQAGRLFAKPLGKERSLHRVPCREDPRCRCRPAFFQNHLIGLH